MKNFHGAIEDYSRALKFDSTYQDYYLMRAYAKGEIKDYLGALTDYNKAIQLRIRSYYLFILNRANMKVELRQLGDALLDYDKSIELNPQSATTYYARGIAKEKVKDFEGPLNDYNKTLEIDSTFYMAGIMAAFARQNIKENDWIIVSSQNGQQWFIKSTYESKDGSIIKIWAKEIKNKAKLLVLAEFDCSSRKSKFISTINYDSKGKVLEHSTDETDWESIPPETTLETMFIKVCDRFN